MPSVGIFGWVVPGLVMVRGARTRPWLVGVRLHVGAFGVEVEIFNDCVVGLSVLLYPAFIAGAHDSP